MDRLLEYLSAVGVTPMELVPVLAAVILAGVVRGFSGFGAAMILVPVYSAVFGPLIAVPLMGLADGFVTAPMVASAMRRCTWREVLPLAVGAIFLLPVGIHVLSIADPLVLRWAMSLFVLAGVVVLISGWRYRRRAPIPATTGIGAAAGFCSGLLGMSGPIIVLFWLAGQSNAAQARANIIAYFGLSAVIAITTYWLRDLLTAKVMVLAVIVAPAYALSLFIGTRLFGKASEETYRRVAMSIIALVAIGSLFA